jgi:hypothetical protein
MQFVTVFSSFSSAEAQLTAARLEVANFHPTVANDTPAATLGGFSESTLIRVEVPEAEGDEVKRFLASAGDVPPQP